MSKETADQIAKWKPQPDTAEWNTRENWEGLDVPKEIALFSKSGITAVRFSKLILKKLFFLKRMFHFF